MSVISGFSMSLQICPSGVVVNLSTNQSHKNGCLMRLMKKKIMFKSEISWTILFINIALTLLALAYSVDTIGVAGAIMITCTLYNEIMMIIMMIL